MRINNFYTASYLENRLSQLLSSKNMILVSQHWNSLIVNLDKKDCSSETTHILFYANLFSVMKRFYKKTYEYFSEQEMYAMIYYAVKVLCYDILRNSYFSSHVQSIEIVFDSTQYSLRVNEERENEKIVENIVKKIDFELFISRIGYRYFTDAEIKEENYPHIFKQICSNEFLPSNYCSYFTKFLKDKNRKAEISYSNFERQFLKLNVSLGKNDLNRFHLSKKDAKFEKFIEQISFKVEGRTEKVTSLDSISHLPYVTPTSLTSELQKTQRINDSNLAMSREILKRRELLKRTKRVKTLLSRQNRGSLLRATVLH